MVADLDPVTEGDPGGPLGHQEPAAGLADSAVLFGTQPYRPCVIRLPIVFERRLSCATLRAGMRV
jgi:hypothetical protein